MSIFLKRDNIKIKNPQSGQYQGQDLFTEGSTTQQIQQITQAGTTQVSAVNSKGAEVLASIPSDYTELSEDVGNLKSAIDLEEIGTNTLTSTYFESGTYNSYFQPISNSARIRSIKIPVHNGVKIKIIPGTVCDYYTYGFFDASGVYSDAVPFSNTKKEINITSETAVIFICKSGSAGTTTIQPSDFDANIVFLTHTQEQISELNDGINSIELSVQMSRHLFYKGTSINLQTKAYKDDSARTTSVPLVFEMDCVISSTSENMVICSDAEGIWSANWVNNRGINAGETIKVIVKHPTSDSSITSAIIDDIKITGSEESIKSFIRNNYYSLDDIKIKTIGNSIEAGYIYSDAQWRGTIQREATQSVRRLKKPIFIDKSGTLDVWSLTLPSGASAHIYKNNTDNTLNEAQHGSYSVDVGDVVDFYNNYSYLNIRWALIPSVVDTSGFVGGAALVKGLNVDIDTAVEYDNKIYTASYRDYKIRIFNKATLEQIAVINSSEAEMGHANTSSIVGNKWYISDGEIPSLVHVFTVSSETVTYEYDITFSTTLAWNQYVFASDGINVFSIGVDVEGDFDHSNTIIEQYTKSGENTFQKVRTIGVYPRYGLMQGNALLNENLYSVISKNDSSYAMRSLLVVNTLTGEAHEIANNLVNTEIEAMIPIDENNALLFSVSGQMYYARHSCN